MARKILLEELVPAGKYNPFILRRGEIICRDRTFKLKPGNMNDRSFSRCGFNMKYPA
jgi:hypothetical protein